MKKKKIIYFDMDGTIVDFGGALKKVPKDVLEKYKDHYDDIPGFFAIMKPINGAIESVRKMYEKLKDEYDFYILTTPPWKNSGAWTDKVEWIQKYIPDIFEKKVIMAHDKSLLIGDYLIDDRPCHGAENFKGKWIRIWSDEFPDWDSILKYFDIE